jgi:hypothetical protein
LVAGLACRATACQLVTSIASRREHEVYADHVMCLNVAVCMQETAGLGLCALVRHANCKSCSNAKGQEQVFQTGSNVYTWSSIRCTAQIRIHQLQA